MKVNVSCDNTDCDYNINNWCASTGITIQLQDIGDDHFNEFHATCNTNTRDVFKGTYMEGKGAHEYQNTDT